MNNIRGGPWNFWSEFFFKLQAHPVQKEVPMLENLLEYYRKSDGKAKKKIPNTIFAEKLVLEKGKVSSPVFTEPIQLILRISEVLRRSEKTKEVDLTNPWLQRDECARSRSHTRSFSVPLTDKSCNQLN